MSMPPRLRSITVMHRHGPAHPSEDDTPTSTPTKKQLNGAKQHKAAKDNRRKQGLLAAGIMLACGVTVWLVAVAVEKRHIIKALPGTILNKVAAVTRVRGGSDGDGAAGANAKGGENGVVKESAAAANASIAQANENLVKIYAKMGTDFAAGGLDTAAIKSMQGWFHGIQEPGETPWPKLYIDFEHSLPPGSVRLLVIPLEHAPAISAAAAAVGKAVMALLPPQIKAFANARSHYHCTLFHTSQPWDPRPDATLPDGGVDLKLQPHERRAPTPQELSHEAEVMRGVVHGITPPTLEVERIAMTPTGTLVMTWLDRTSAVAELRGRLRGAFPGASTKQASIIHTSLVRIVSDVQLDQATITKIQAVCDEWTQRLRGMTMTPPATWWVQEREFSTIEGDKSRFYFKPLPQHPPASQGQGQGGAGAQAQGGLHRRMAASGGRAQQH